MPDNRAPERRTGMIHCEKCGEDYSATYKRCPFCEEDADYVRRTPSRSGGSHSGRGGKRVASSGGRGSGSRGGGDWDFNLFRIIGIVVPLCFIAAALYIIITVLGPMISAGRETPDTSGSPSPGVTTPAETVSPSPESSPSTDPEPVAPTVTGITLDQSDFTLEPGASYRINASVTPADAGAQVVWSVDNTSALTVGQDGTVTNVYTGTGRVTVTVTATAGDITATCTVRCKGSGGTSTPSTDTPSTGGALSAGPAQVANAGGGVRVRSGPGTDYEPLASLFNGDDVNIVSAADGGWYQITFQGSGGATVTGYMLGEYLSQG